MRISAGLLLGGVGILLPFLASGSTLEHFHAAWTTFAFGGLTSTLASLAAVLIIEAQIRSLELGERIASKFSGVGTKAALALLPGVLGLLPATAGARFSVGVVRALGQHVNVSPETLAVINFWFRHVNIFCNPLISGTILALGLTELSARELLLPGIPFAVSSALIGWMLFVKPLVVLRQANPEAKVGVPFSLLERSFLALIPASLIFAFVFPKGLFVALTPALGVGAWAVRQKFGLHAILKLLRFETTDRRIFGEVALIFWFTSSMEATGLTAQLVSGLFGTSLPPVLSIALAAFAVTMVTGLCLPSIALVMPVAIGLYPGDGAMLYTVLLASFLAQFVTPAHLCLVVSAEAFGARTSSVITRLLPALLFSVVPAATCLVAMHLT